MDVVERVKRILTNPKEEWPNIAAESASTQSLYVGYIMILAAIGPAAIVIRGLVFGSALDLAFAIGMYLLALVAVSIIALIVDLLAPTFGAQRDFVASLKLVAYAYTAVWVAGIFWLIPALGGIAALLAWIYAIYTFALGVVPLKKCPADKAVSYTIIVLICSIVLFWLLHLMMVPMGGGMGGLATIGMTP